MKEKAVAKAVVSASADGPRKFTHINASAASADGPRKFTHINASASVDGSRISSRDKKKVVNYAEESVEATSRALTQNRKVLNTNVKVLPKRMPRPTRNSENELLFDDHKEFKPNLTPQEIIEMGSFGGTYFRPIHSSVTGLDYRDEHKEFEDLGWYTNVNIKRMVTSNVYNNDVNKFRCSCGGDLEMWESSNWITSIDPYGWYQWYCRFYEGRRSTDDDRQISRANGVMGPKGRFRSNLFNKIIAVHGSNYDKGVSDSSISPVIRQTLQHWGLEVTTKALSAYHKKK